MSGRVGQARKRDGNEASIIRALQKIGVIVMQLSAPGMPDLLCFHPYTGLFLCEVKREKGKLTPAQQALDPLVPFHVVRSEEEAVAAFLSEWPVRARRLK